MTPTLVESGKEMRNREPKTDNNDGDNSNEDEPDDFDDTEYLAKYATFPVTPDTDISSMASTLNISDLKYDGKKPKWWKQLYGRRATKGQRRAMTCLEEQHYKLPKLPYGETIDWDMVFPIKDEEEQESSKKEIWLELGFGNGENLLVNSQFHQSKNIGFVGAEVCQPGVGVAMKRMYEAIQCGSYWSDYNLYTLDKDPHHDINVIVSASDNAQCENNKRQAQQQQEDAKTNATISTSKILCPYDNIRIYPGDGIKLLPSIPSCSISTLLVTFPDPFPKSNHKKHRLIQVHTLQEMHRVLTKTSPVGRLFIATDHEGYFEWCLDIFDLLNSTCSSSTGAERNDSKTNRKDIHGKDKYAIANDNNCDLLTNGTKFCRILNVPDRSTWLPAISKYEQKGWNEGRKTMLQCWEVVS